MLLLITKSLDSFVYISVGNKKKLKNFVGNKKKSKNICRIFFFYKKKLLAAVSADATSPVKYEK
jgi:hypothetical protein